MTRSIILASAALLSSIAFAAPDAAGSAPTPTDPVESATERTNQALAILSDEDKVGSIKKVLKAREVFPTLDLAIAKLQKAAEATENFYGLPYSITGLNPATGEVDNSRYEGNKVVLAYVGGRVTTKAKGEDKNLVGIKGIVIYPMPTLESIINSEDGAKWIEKTAEKEIALVAFRNFREAATLFAFEQGVDKVASTVSALVADAERGGNGLDTDTFDALWKDTRDALKDNAPALAALLPGKAEVLKCIRSESYAKENEPDLEGRGIFVWLANVIIKAAESNEDKQGNADPLDPAAIKEWLEGRSTLEIKKADAKARDFSALDSMQLPTFA